jgi:hypothetical protein
MPLVQRCDFQDLAAKGAPPHDFAGAGWGTSLACCILSAGHLEIRLVLLRERADCNNVGLNNFNHSYGAAEFYPNPKEMTICRTGPLFDLACSSMLATRSAKWL